MDPSRKQSPLLVDGTACKCGFELGGQAGDALGGDVCRFAGDEVGDLIMLFLEFGFLDFVSAEGFEQGGGVACFGDGVGQIGDLPAQVGEAGVEFAQALWSIICSLGI